MRTRVGLFALCGVAMVLCGCAGNSMISHKTVRSARWYGDVGITGHQNIVTIEKESLVFELSIMGDNNEITVEDGASLAKIEIWGSSNTISLPAGMHPKYRNIGDNNKVTNRPIQLPDNMMGESSYMPTEPSNGATSPPPSTTTPPASEKHDSPQPAEDTGSIYP